MHLLHEWQMAFDGRLLSGLSVLAAVIEAGSFARAGDAIGLSPSAVSRAIARLEERVGVRLLDRTTRSMALTDEGRRFYQDVAPLLAGIEDAATAASGAANKVRGRMRVNVDPFFSRLVLARHVAKFLEKHPELSLELVTSDAIGDLVADGFDLAVRFGDPPAGALISRKLLETRIVTVASPGYLAAHGTPKKPADLAEHSCILFRNPITGQPFEWELRRGSQVVEFAAKGRLTVSDVDAMLGACVSDVGIAQVMALGSEQLLANGKLIDIFPTWNGERFPLYALFPSRRHPPAKVRAFIELCIAAAN
jgi:DNA-binding transcriptional LysR family regulator